MKHFEKEGIETEEGRKMILKELEQKYVNAAKLAVEYEEKSQSNKKILDQCRVGKLHAQIVQPSIQKVGSMLIFILILPGIDSLFKKINCDRTQIEMLLLSKEGVTEANMSQYLGIIDSRTDELLKWQSLLAAKVLL